MKIKIKVTESDIKWSKLGDGESCPIAQAITRAGYKPSAGYFTIYATCAKTGKVYSTRTPTELTKFMRRYDHYETVEPFNTELKMEKK